MKCREYLASAKVTQQVAAAMQPFAADSVVTAVLVRAFLLGSNELMHAQHYPTASLAGASTEAARLSTAHQQQQGPQTPRRGAADGTKPPKKPLTPYMIFSKRVCDT